MVGVPIRPRPTLARRRVSSRFGTEFGLVLMRLVEGTPGAIAAVLSDDEGDAIDFVHDAREIDDIDVQLLGAQVGQSVLVLGRSAGRHHLFRAAVLLETRADKLVAGPIENAYILALLLERRANVARALAAFEEAAARISEMI